MHVLRGSHVSAKWSIRLKWKCHCPDNFSEVLIEAAKLSACLVGPTERLLFSLCGITIHSKISDDSVHAHTLKQHIDWIEWCFIIISQIFYYCNWFCTVIATHSSCDSTPSIVAAAMTALYDRSQACLSRTRPGQFASCEGEPSWAKSQHVHSGFTVTSRDAIGKLVSSV